MAVSYNKLWKMMIDKHISKMELTHLAGISTNAMAKLDRDEDVRVRVLEKLCTSLDGKLEGTGIGSEEASNTAFNFLKANESRISGSIGTTTKDYIINYQDLQGIGMTGKTLIAMCSIALGIPVQSSTAVLGGISISGTLIKADNLADTLQICLDSGAKKILLPQTSFVDFATVPTELMSAFQLIPYQSAEDAVFKVLGVE